LFLVPNELWLPAAVGNIDRGMAWHLRPRINEVSQLLLFVGCTAGRRMASEIVVGKNA